MIYLAYGSNMATALMTKRCPDARLIDVGYIEGYRLVYKGAYNRAYATIEKTDRQYVPVAIWEISEADEVILDDYEDYPDFYTKLYIEAKGQKKAYQGMVYVMNESYTYMMPTQAYIESILLGYQEFGFDIDVLNQARTVTQANMV